MFFEFLPLEGVCIGYDFCWKLVMLIFYLRMIMLSMVSTRRTYVSAVFVLILLLGSYWHGKILLSQMGAFYF